MENEFIKMANSGVLSVRRRYIVGVAVAALLLAAGTRPLLAQEQILFPAGDNGGAPIVSKIRSEQVRLDIALWLLNDGEITQAIIDRYLAGVPVRVLGDRAGIFESDPETRAPF